MKNINAVRVSCVSYLNSAPFVYGLNQLHKSGLIDLSLDIPSVCSEKMIHGKADIGLVPVASIIDIPNAERISKWCIAANGPVKSVTLLSHVPLQDIENIMLDYHSVTSVNLSRILANYFWKIDPVWKNTIHGFENKISGTTAAIVIGDRSLQMRNDFPYVYDLAEEWKKFTGLPFVFACWISNTELSKEFLMQFDDALSFGVNHLDNVIAELKQQPDFYSGTEEYLKKFLEYNFDDAKNQGLNLFLDYKSRLSVLPVRELQ